MLDAAQFHAALGRGDRREAASWLVRAHASEVLSLCRAIVRDSGAAEDLAQDTFASAFAGLSELRLTGAPRAWLLSIARNRCIDHLRRTKRSPYGLAKEAEVVEMHPDDDAPLGPELVERREDVLRGLAVLDEAARALVMLRFRHGLEYGELAEVFGQKAGTIRMRLSRALSRMRAELGEPTMAALTDAAPPKPQPSAAAPRPPVPAAPPALRRPAPPAPSAPPPLRRPAPPVPSAPPPLRRPAPPAAAPPRHPSSAAGAPPPPSRKRSVGDRLLGRAAPPPPPPEPQTAFARLLTETDEASDALLARLEALAADL